MCNIQYLYVSLGQSSFCTLSNYYSRRLLLTSSSTPLPTTHALHLPPHTNTTTATTWLYQNSGVWINSKESQIWYWTIPEVETLPLFNNFRRNFFFKISKPVHSQWLPESSLWTLLFKIENSFEIWLGQIPSSPLDLCSDCCLLFQIPLTSGLGN